MPGPGWRKCVEAISRGDRFEAETQTRITASELRQLLTGTVPRRFGFHLFQDTGFVPSVVLDGGEAINLTIVSDGDSATAPFARDRFLDLRNLTHRNGGPLPPLVLRNCRIEGGLDISGSHFAGLQLENCSTRGIRGDGAQIENDFTIDGLQPLEPNWAPDNGKTSQCCQLRLVALRVDGSFTLRRALLISPTLSQWTEAPGHRDCLAPSGVGHFGNRFALTLGGAEIGGRVWIDQDVVALGGISLYQTIIRASLRMDAHCVAAHDATEIGGSNSAALSAEELRVGGAFLWGSPADSPSEFAVNWVFGRIVLVRARIESDLLFETCRFLPTGAETKAMIARLARRSEGRAPIFGPQETVVADELLDLAMAPESGGIDLRRASIGGQLTFYGSSAIGRRSRSMTGRQETDVVGASVDAWKAEIALGILIGRGAQLHGPLFFNSCKIGREVAIAGSIDFSCKGRKRLRGPYHVALSFANSDIDGHFDLSIPRITGRVELDRLRINGSAEIKRIAFQGLDPPHYPRKKPPFDETSILDMQDMRVSGGINIKRRALSITLEKPGLWRNGFIVDMRGMCCASWDDADATCWVGLTHAGRWAFAEDRPALTRWRLKFEGLRFERLENSLQSDPLDPSTTNGYWRALRVRRWIERTPVMSSPQRPRPGYRDLRAFRALAALLAAARAALLFPLVARNGSFLAKELWLKLSDAGRSYHTLSRRETTRFRLAALESFHRNRWRPTHRSLRNGIFRRWTWHQSWKRREFVPLFSPQPYDQFARAYSLGGSSEIADAITVRRLTTQWRRWCRMLVQTTLSIRSLTALTGALLIAFYLAYRIGWWWPLFGVTIAFLIPVIAGLGLAIFRYGFGYGLYGENTLLALVAFVIVAGASPTILTPLMLPAHCRATADSLIPMHVSYGLDLLVPADLGERDDLLDPLFKAEKREELRRQSRTHPLDEAQMVESRTISNCIWKTRQKFDILHDIATIFGWIFLSLVVLTFSGLLRRDLEKR